MWAFLKYLPTTLYFIRDRFSIYSCYGGLPQYCLCEARAYVVKLHVYSDTCY